MPRAAEPATVRGPRANVNADGAQSFGDLLRRYRIAAGLTQELLAERSRMSLAAIGKLERGDRQRPYRATIALLADALSLGPSDRAELERAAKRSGHPFSDREADPAASNLPAYFSSFVGRERDLAKAGELLRAHRIVTLVGAGGVGKTRLAIRAAEQHISATSTDRRLDGAWFTDLSSLTDEAMLPMIVASSIGINGCRTLDALIAFLRPQAFLLILDNCEHVLAAVADAATAIVSSCPNARILATSRQALSVEGEWIYRVPPLSFPTRETRSANDALEFDAIRLFNDRAEATDSRFALTDAVASDVVEICRRVDGIALAIELAAARTSAFSPAIIAEQIREHFSLLTGGSRTALPRHKTLDALFDWSYDLLDAREREMFRRSSTFVSGFTLDLMSALYAGRDDVAQLLASLVEKSFVQCDIHIGPRYRLLEPARQYARRKLGEHREQNDAARSHALALLSLAERFDSRLDLIPDVDWDTYVLRERENFAAAFEWALGPDGDDLIAQRLAASRTATWSGIGSGEARRWLSAVLQRCRQAVPPQLMPELAITEARIAIHFERDPEARAEVCRRALVRAQGGDARSLAAAQYYFGLALTYLGDRDGADRALREARATARVAGAQTELNNATTALGAERLQAGDLVEARSLIEDALCRSKDASSERSATGGRVILAEIEFASGSYEAALALSQKAAQSFRSHLDLVRLSTTLSNAAAYLIALGRYAEAWDNANEALRRSRAIGSLNAALWALQHLAAIAVLRDDREKTETTFARGTMILGFVDEAAKQGARRTFTERHEYERTVSTLREVFSDDEVGMFMARGRTWSEERAVAEALAL